MAKTITLVIDSDGNREISTEGFTGEDCLEAARPLLGGQDGHIVLTGEYYEEAEERQHVPAGGDS